MNSLHDEATDKNTALLDEAMMNPSQESFPLLRGLEVFLQGFSATRSRTHPYLIHHLSPTVWTLADAPRKKGAARQTEVIVYGGDPEETLETIRQGEIGRHMLCVLTEEAATHREIVAAYKRHGYRACRNEPLFVLPLAQRRAVAAYPVRRIVAEGEAETVAKAAGSRQILSEHLTQGAAPTRLYAAFDGETPIGWVSSVRTHPDCAWVSNLFVEANYRRRGVGKSLMSAMLEEDAAFGVTYSVLLSTQTGSKLYPHLGYEARGLLVCFYPPKAKPAP